MLYLTLTVVFIFIGLLTFIPRLNKAVQRYAVGVNFFLTLIATLVGVLLAISITNYDQAQKEKDDVVKLLNSAMTSVDSCLDYSEALVDYYKKLPTDDKTRHDFFIKNPLPYPQYLDTFLMQNIVSKNISGEALSDLNEYLINLKRSRTGDTGFYVKALKQTLALLDSEIEFQQGNINERQLDIVLDGIKERQF